MPHKQEVKEQYRELINQGKYKERKLNYTIAVSSGLNVVPEIPDEAYKRIGWASNQGASFVEAYIGGPSQIYNEWDNLVSISRQLGLSMDAHTPVNVPIDFANPYREQSQQLGFFYTHEFLYDFIESWGELKEAIESQADAHGNQQYVHGINSHLVKSTIPPRKERMARSIAVDPFGEEMMESKIFNNPAFRVGFFKHYLWPEELRDNFDTLKGIASDIEGFRDFNIIFRHQSIDHMSKNGYLTNRMLEAVSNIDDTDRIIENLDYIAENKPKLFDYEREIGSYIQQAHTESPGPTQPSQLTDRGEELMEALGESPAKAYLEMSPGEKEELIEGRGLLPNLDMMRSSAIQNIAGTRTDVPEELGELRDHREGATIAQNIPRFDPNLHTNSRWVPLIPKIFWELDEDQELRDPKQFQAEMDTVVESCKEELHDAIAERLERQNPYEGDREYFYEDEVNRQMSEGEVAFRDIINFRGGAYRDNMSRPSVVFWHMMPMWMPFSGNPHLEYIWREITEIDPDNYSLENLDEFSKELEDLKDSQNYEWVVAAGAGAYVWGHFTQVIGPGQDMTLVEMLDHKGLTLDWESHSVGPEGKSRLWKPHDIIKVAQAINNTEVNGETHEVVYCTIDMEHLAVNGIEPLWAIEGNKEKGFRGLDEGDGAYIVKQHITHPALSSQKHHHQPIRRGDTTVYRHIESLVERGFCKREDRPAIMLYELGEEKAESTYMLRLMLHMLEKGITSEELESGKVDQAMEKFDNNSEDLTLKEYMILKFFGLTDEEWHHEWQSIFEHALDPLSGLLEMESPDKTWSGSRPIQEGTRPEEWEKEKYQ